MWPQRLLSQLWLKHSYRCSSAKPKLPASCVKSLRLKKKSPPKRRRLRKPPIGAMQLRHLLLKPHLLKPLSLKLRLLQSSKLRSLLSFKHQRSKHRSLLLFNHQRLRPRLSWPKLQRPPRPPRHHRLRRVLLFQVVLLRANQRVTSLVKRRARLHHDPTHLVPIHRDRLLVERLVALLARRLVVR